MNRKLISLISFALVLEMTASAVSFPGNDILLRSEVYAVDAGGTCGENITWEINKGLLEIKGMGAVTDSPWLEYSENITDVKIYENINVLPEGAFKNCENLRNIEIPEAVTAIPESCFSGCRSLQAIELPSGITKIKSRSFENCVSLSEITIPEGVVDLESYAFSGCINLKKAVLDDALRSILNGAFENCISLEKIELPEKFLSFGMGAFYGCSALNSISFPDKMKELPQSAFYGCSSLKKIVFPKAMYRIGISAFEGCRNLSEVVIPEDGDIRVLDSFIFKDCIGLTEIRIPKAVTYIVKDAFEGCTNLKTVYGTEGSGAQKFAETAGIKFVDPELSAEAAGRGMCGEEAEWKLEDGVLEITGTGEVTSAPWIDNKDDITELIISDEITAVPEKAFEYCKNLKSAVLSDSMTVLPERVFGVCSSLEEIVIPESITEIEQEAFCYCSSLTEITIPGKVSSIKTYTFAECEKLEKVVLSDSVREIGQGAFMKCTGLKEIFLPEGVEFADASAFFRCDDYLKIKGIEGSYAEEYASKAGKEFVAVKIVYNGSCGEKALWTLESGVLEITGTGEVTSAPWLDRKDKITEVRISDEITSVPKGAFKDCKNLKSVSLSEHMTVLSENIFSGCTSLDNVIIPDSVSFIEKAAFSSCPSLTGIKIPEKVKIIDTYAFFECTALEEVILPDTLSEIRTSAFWGCSGLKEIFLPECIETIDGMAFASCPDLVIKGTEGSCAETYAVKNGIEFVPVRSETTGSDSPSGKSFLYNRDNWSFNNTSDYYTGKTYRDQIDRKYLDKLSDSLTNSEYRSVFEGYTNTSGKTVNAALDEEWRGSCYGMSAAALLAYNGLLKYRQFTAGAGNLFSLQSPAVNSDVRSLITYYQMLQYKDDIVQKRYRIKQQTARKNIEMIISEIEKYGTAVVGFTKYNWGSHAVIAYDHAEGLSWKFGDRIYNGCIRIYDPYYSISENDNYFIYYDRTTYEWMIPAYQEKKVDSYSGAQFYFISGDFSEINKGGFLNGIDDAESESTDYVARLDTPDIAERAVVGKADAEENGDYMMQGAGDGDIIPETIYSANGSGRGVNGYNLKDAESGYMIKQNAVHSIETIMKYENCLLSGSSAAGEEVIFDKYGYVSVSGENAEYTLEMTFNKDYPTDWFTVTVNGKAAKAELEKAESGYILKSDNMENVSVTAGNREIRAEVSFSSDYKEVYLYEIDENTIGVGADKDGDGEYETLVARSREGIRGDVNSDGKTDEKDIVLIKKYISGETPGRKIPLADVNEDGEINIFDIMRLRKALIGK